MSSRSSTSGTLFRGALVPAVALGLCAAFLAPVPCALRAQGLDEAEPQIGFFENQGVRLRYWQMGSGDTLVLVHGLFGDADVWKEFAPLSALAREWHVVAIDLRGHGESGKPQEPGSYGRALAADIVALLDHLGVRRAHVLGYSYGGLVVGALLADHPDRLISAIIGGSSRIRPDFPEDVAWSEQLAAALEAENGAEWLADALAAGDPAQNAAQRALIERRIEAADLRASAAVLRSTSALAVSDAALRANPVPTLALVGARDPNHDEVVDMATITRGMIVETIAEADHASAPRASVFWELVVDWLREGRG